MGSPEGPAGPGVELRGVTIALQSRAVRIRDEAAYMACGVWMVVGLYLDGWSHQANKPESFFTPWHALLYSGFGAAVVWSGWIAVRDARLAESERSPTLDDRITSLGVAPVRASRTAM